MQEKERKKEKEKGKENERERTRRESAREREREIDKEREREREKEREPESRYHENVPRPWRPIGALPAISRKLRKRLFPVAAGADFRNYLPLVHLRSLCARVLLAKVCLYV